MSVKSYDRLYIGGEWVEPSSSATIEVVSPNTEEVIATVPEGKVADIDRAVAAARQAFNQGPWPKMTPVERAAVVAKVSDAITADMQGMAEIISEEMGSPVGWGVLGQVLAPTMVLNFYTDLATKYPFDEVRQGVLGSVLVTKEAVGVVGAIIPWNVPLFITVLKLAPALIAGCTVVLKPSPEAALSPNRFAEICAEAGIPPGVLNVVPAGREAGEHLVTHAGVDKISFTGSTAAGKRIGGLCGERLKRCSLELGGKSAAILLDDVNLAEALPLLMPNALMNNGQACIGQTRIVAPRDRYQEVVDAVVEYVRTLKVGNSLDPEVAIGPLVARRQRDRVEEYIHIGQVEGAKVAIGGGRPAGLDKGWFVEPTVFVNVGNSMRIAQEEIFGPVLAVIAHDGDESAIAIANDSEYGLCGSVYTGDNERGLSVARSVRTGTYMLNGFAPFDFAAPFGGCKNSGIGRECGPEGLELFLEPKSVTLPAGFTPAGLS